MTRDGAFAFGTVTRVEPSPDLPWQWGQNVKLG